MKTQLLNTGKTILATALLSAVQLSATAQTSPCDVPIVVDVQTQDPLCYGDNNGWIDLNISGGIPSLAGDPYEIRWNKNDFNGMNQLNGLMTGTYEVVIIDSVGCNYSTSITLEAPPQIIIDETHVNPNLTNAGSIDITVSGGVGPYLYDWSTGSSTEDIYNLQPDIYEVTVKDANGCEANETIELSLVRRVQFGGINSTIGNNTSSRDLGNVVILYPNPSPGSVMITWGDLDVKTVRVLRNDGFVDKFKKISDEQRLEINDLPTGAYRVYLSTFSGATITRSLQVMN
jgi:hypothetical protein